MIQLRFICSQNRKLHTHWRKPSPHWRLFPFFRLQI